MGCTPELQVYSSARAYWYASTTKARWKKRYEKKKKEKKNTIHRGTSNQGELDKLRRGANGVHRPILHSGSVPCTQFREHGSLKTHLVQPFVNKLCSGTFCAQTHKKMGALKQLKPCKFKLRATILLSVY
mmetsp:Transcript_141326/g.246407  ORF Transcript_141326/g.246407 Transcript_141326/m.246407 type:complete len:130 (-) Transcript_141326:145-534(-)